MFHVIGVESINSYVSVQIAELKRGAEIIVCTPGRMIDMLTANNGRLNMKLMVLLFLLYNHQ